jgi:hypothetical protein
MANGVLNETRGTIFGNFPYSSPSSPAGLSKDPTADPRPVGRFVHVIVTVRTRGLAR